MAMRGRSTLALRTFLSIEAFSGVQGERSTLQMDGALGRVLQSRTFMFPSNVIILRVSCLKGLLFGSFRAA